MQAYYTGAGVFHHEGVDYPHGKVLPANVPAETIKKMKKNGKASETAPASVEPAGTGELAALRGQVKGLAAQLTNVTGERDEALDMVGKARVEVGRLQEMLTNVTGERDRAQGTIEELTKAQLTPAAPAPPVKK